jgi:(p)ppGpp synthase/HD superfamily hydrolase
VNYLEPCYYSSRLLEKLKLLDNKNVLNFELINKSIYWARKYHGDQKRKSGEPYYSHPLEVAYMVSDYNLKTDVIAASILHDIIEDTEVTAGMILDNFSWRIAEMVDRLTRYRPDGNKLSVEQVLNNAYQLKDVEVLMIKMIDRIHNLETAKFLNEEKKTKIKKLTLIDFLALALDIEYYEFFDKMLSLCIEKKHPIFEDILSLRSIELNQSLYRFKDLPYYDF